MATMTDNRIIVEYAPADASVGIVTHHPDFQTPEGEIKMTLSMMGEENRDHTRMRWFFNNFLTYGLIRERPKNERPPKPQFP